MNQTEIVKIEKIVFGGKGLARINSKVALIDEALPGETVKALLTPKKHFFEGKIKEIITPSPFRTEKDCPYNECGGCDFRHCSYQYELDLKKEILVDTLQRIGKTEIDKNSISVLASQRNRYRIKTGFKSKNGRIGFYEKKSHKIVDIKTCLQIPEIAEKKLQQARKKKIKKDFFIETHPFEEKAYLYFKGKGKEIIKLEFEQYVMLHKIGNFIQANRLILKDFVKTVCEMAGKGEKMLELYCGSGLFTLPLSKKFKQIYAYENSPEAVEMLKQSAAINGFGNISIFLNLAENFSEKQYDTILLDPPREGAGKTIMEKIIKSKPEKIVYVSCNASTFARDTNYLSNFYEIKKIVLIDNFPATAHFETVAVLKRIN